MRILVFVKEVLDPDAVNNYALAGRLSIGEDGRTITQSAIPRLMNAYDEQAMEAALRIRDAGIGCAITAVSAGPDQGAILKHAASLGADEIVSLQADTTSMDCMGVAAMLSAYVRHSGGGDLLLFGRQASDDDQGVVPALVAEALGMPLVTIARDLSVDAGAPAVRVTRVTPLGDEVVECDCPAVVTVSSELGQPRYPTAARMMAARRMQPVSLVPGDVSLDPASLKPAVRLEKLYTPQVQGNCEFVDGETAREKARQLVQRLRAENIL